MLALIVLDGNADLPQHLLVHLADCRSQRPHGGRGVEIENRHKIFMAEILLRFQPAAGHQGQLTTSLHKAVHAALGVVTAALIEDSSGGGAQLISGVVRHGLALEGVDEAGTEHIGADTGALVQDSSPDTGFDHPPADPACVLTKPGWA